MFRSKKDIDAHVRDVFSKCNSETERIKLCFGIAKQYTVIKEFDSARRYLESYLASGPNAGDSAAAKKVMGDVLLELGDCEKALENYKASYEEGKSRESLNRICDLLTRGFGINESAESKNKWFDLQKHPMNSVPSASNNLNGSPGIPRRTHTITGPPKTGFGHASSFMNGSPSPLAATPSKTVATNVDLQLRYLERRFDDGFGKIMDQNGMVLEQLLKMKDDMKLVNDKIEGVSSTQQQIQAEMKAHIENQKLPQELMYPPMTNRHLPIREQHCQKCDNTNSQPIEKTPSQQATVEYTALKDQLGNLEKLTSQAFEGFQKQQELHLNLEQRMERLENLTMQAIEGFKKANPITPINQPVNLEKHNPYPEPVPSARTKVFTSQDVKTPVIPKTENKPISELFKNPEGNWDCAECYVSNTKDAIACIACATSRPGFERIAKSEPVPAAIPQLPAFNFGFPPASHFGSSGFGLTTPVSAVSSTVTDGVPNKSEEKKDSPFINLNLAGKFSFADLAKNDISSNSFTFGSQDTMQNFSGTGAPLFSASTPVAGNKSIDEKTVTPRNVGEEGEDDFVPTAEFQPVIPLPPIVEVKKGDEDEDTIVEYRAKIYRFITETKEWKERGVGNIKLLQSKDNPSKSRVVMWREKVGKLACNFNLFPDIKVTNYQNNAKVLCWKCQDHAEEPAWETFTCRFSNEDNCAKFKVEMERLASLSSKVIPASPPDSKNVTTTVDGKTLEDSKLNKEADEIKKLSELFKKPEGSWDCAICYVSNTKDANACVACETCRPGFEGVAKPEPVPAVTTQLPTFSFGFQPTSQFGNIGFGLTTPVSSIVVDGTPNKSEEQKDPQVINLNLAGKLSFADLAINDNSSNSNSFTFGSKDGMPNFSGAGAPLFSASTPVNANKSIDEKNASSRNAGEEGEDDFIPTAEFQPVIPLPPIVEVKKGDEDEDTIVEYRAKIYRFITETKEWKERGVGNIKLLQSKDNPSKSRVVMWREKVGKLACNFNLFPDIKVTNYQNNEKVLCWKCQDHAEEPAWETFTCRFSNEDNCAKFKVEMERLASLSSKVIPTSPSESKSVSTTEDRQASENKAAEEIKKLSELFKKPEGSWDCAICYVSNTKDANACVACETCRPGFEGVTKPEPVPAVTTQLPTFSFGFPPTSQFGNIGFGLTAPVSSTVADGNPNKSEEKKDSPFINLNLAGKLSFADLAKNDSSGNSNSFTFGSQDGMTNFSGAGAPLFSASTPVAGNKSINEKTATSPNAGEEGEDDFVPSTEFQPVIPLPPIVEVKKGDEDEDTIVEYRAKIYRFMYEAKEWKERGVGNIKLLQSKENPSKSRVVMWREKVGKLACNFNLFPDIKVTNYQNNAKVLCWKCQDHAEEPAWETFTCRFATEENCAHFKREMERLAVADSSCLKETSSCPGCAGCDPDSFKFPEYSTSSEEQLVELPLSSDAASDDPSIVTLALFETVNGTATESNSPSVQVVPELGILGNDTSIISNRSDTSNDNGLSSFSFSLPTPENNKSNPISFQFKSPAFSFKPPTDGSPSIFGGSIFSSPLGNAATGTSPSTFVPPFAQPSMPIFNNTTPPAFSFAGVPQSNTNADVSSGEQRDEEDYEDVEDEEEECMFEDDAHIYIQDDTSGGFSDKGEGVVRVLYDGDSYCARLAVVVNGETIVDHLVAAETELKPTGSRTYEWIGICDDDTPVKSRIKATFTNDESCHSFSTVMADSVEFANQAGVTEADLLEDSYGD